MATAEQVRDIPLRTEGGQLAEMRRLIDEANRARSDYEAAGADYAAAANAEAKLEAERPQVKHDAAARIMADGKVAATNAEKLASSDPDYLKHLAYQRQVVSDKNHAHTRLESARMRVEIALAAVKMLMGGIS